MRETQGGKSALQASAKTGGRLSSLKHKRHVGVQSNLCSYMGSKIASSPNPNKRAWKERHTRIEDITNNVGNSPARLKVNHRKRVNALFSLRTYGLNHRVWDDLSMDATF